MIRTLLSCFLGSLCFSLWAQQPQPCKKSSTQLATYSKILPTEKVHIHSDQNYYEPGATIWYKAYLTDAALNATAISGQLRVDFFDGIGNKVGSNQLYVADGVANGDFTLSSDAIGGIYTLRAYTSWQQNFGEAPAFEKKLTIQRYTLPNLLMTLDFMRERYGPGAEVSAKLLVRSKDDKPLANKKCNYTLALAGKKYTGASFNTDAEGRALIVFRLPEDLKTADGLLNVTIEHDGSTESISRSVPIMTRQLSLQLLPEGGDLVDGFRSRIAFKALDEFGKPVDFKGVVVDQNGKELTTFESYHQGLGAFFISAKKGENYKVKILEPKGIATTYPLPKVLPAAVGMRVDAQTTNKILFTIYSPKAQPLCIAVQMQDKVVYDLGIEAKKGENTVEIPTQNLPLGIAQITLLDAAEIPQTERLVFVNKHRQLKIEIKTNKPFYQVRDSIWIDIAVTDETGKGVKGDFSMAVVDDKLWTFADDKQDNILSNLLMSSDLKGQVYEPNFYFDPKESKADTALDYVMLTHGWRRYNWRELMANNAEANWKKQRRFEPDPATGIAGRLMSGGQPIANAIIHIEPIAVGADCYKGLKTISTDANGNFFLPNFDGTCPLYLKAQYRGIHVKNGIHINNNHRVQVVDRKLNQGVFLQRQPFQPTKISNKVEKGFYAEFQAAGNGAVQGMIRDADAESLMGGAITLNQNGKVVYGVMSDMDGKYEFKNVNTGLYDLEIRYIGFKTIKTELGVMPNKILVQDVNMEEEQVLLDAVVTIATAPRVEIETKTTMVRAEIQTLGVRSNSSLAVVATTTTEVIRVQELPRNEGRKMQELAPDAGMTIDNVKLARTPLASRKKLELAVQKVPITSGNEAGGQIEMLRLRGEMGNFVINDPIQDNIERGDGSVVQPSFQLTQVGYPPYYGAKVFMAPDYTEYLQAQRKGLAGTLSRSDFRKTIYWRPYLQTDAEGKARVLFFNSDATTTFRIVVEGIAAGGKVGRKEHTYSVQMPFEIGTKMPSILTYGDTVLLQVILKNNRNEDLIGRFAAITGGGLRLLLDSVSSIYQIPANSFVRLELPFLTLPGQSKQRMIIGFEAMGMSDEINVEYEVRSKGFPIELTISGNEVERSGRFQINQLVQGSLNAKLEVYANVLEDMKSSMEGMLREPYGCFEQVSSSNYPNILALQYMKSTNSLDPAVYDRAYGYLNNGYKKLAGYESAGGGFEWFGGSPAHEGLTAFGLMEFKDMTAVYSGVDAAMVERAEAWLLSRRNGNGGFQAATGYNHGWGNSQAVSNAYITYALAYIGNKSIKMELQQITIEAEKSKDLYRLGLATLANFYDGQNKTAENLLNMLNAEIDKVGIDKLSGEHSITYSTGAALYTEILGIVITAILKSEKPDVPRLRKYAEVLLKNRSHGHFGSTQSTVWALKSLNDYAIYVGDAKTEQGNLVLYVNGEKAVSQAINTKNSKNLVFDELTKYFKEGENELELKFEGIKEAMPYSLRVEWATLTPQSSKQCLLNIETSLSATTAKVGETVRLTTVLKNNSDKDAPSAMALIGIPAGLSLQPWQLKEILETEKADFYEIIDNYLVLYYRSIRARETRIINIDLKAEVPGSYRAAASRTYMYYTAENKDWEEGEMVKIVN